MATYEIRNGKCSNCNTELEIVHCTKCRYCGTPIPNLNNEWVLLVDDAESSLDVFAMLLTNRGYNIVTAANGAIGWEAVSSSGIKFDLIISDINMPVMDGYLFGHKLSKSIYCNIPLILFSGIESPPVETTEFLKAKAYLDKPANISEVLALIQKVLKENPSN